MMTELEMSKTQNRVSRNTITALRKIWKQASQAAIGHGLSPCETDTVIARAFLDVIVQEKILHLKAHHADQYHPANVAYSIGTEIGDSVAENWSDMNVSKDEFDS